MSYPQLSMEQIVLSNDFGKEISFKGRIFSECSYYDEETHSITRQRLYVTDQGEQVYFIATGSGPSKERRVYKLKVEGENCVIDNGAGELVIGTELLIASMRTLCGFNEGCSEGLLSSLEETLKAANV